MLNGAQYHVAGVLTHIHLGIKVDREWSPTDRKNKVDELLPAAEQQWELLQPRVEAARGEIAGAELRQHVLAWKLIGHQTSAIYITDFVAGKGRLQPFNRLNGACWIAAGKLI